MKASKADFGSVIKSDLISGYEGAIIKHPSPTPTRPIKTATGQYQAASVVPGRL